MSHKFRGEKKSNHLRTAFLPNTTPVPNWFFDFILAEQMPHELRSVFLFLIRKTIGWNNASEEQTLNHIERGACVSRNVAVRAVQVFCDCWGLWKRIPGRGRHMSVFEVSEHAAWTKERVWERRNWVQTIYQSDMPTLEQLRARPCTAEVLAEGERLWKLSLREI